MQISIFSLLIPITEPTEPEWTVTEQTTNSVTISINGVSGSRDSYLIRYNVFGASPAVEVSVTSSDAQTTFNVTGLTSGTRYEFEVFAVAGGILSGSTFDTVFTCKNCYTY